MWIFESGKARSIWILRALLAFFATASFGHVASAQAREPIGLLEELSGNGEALQVSRADGDDNIVPCLQSAGQQTTEQSVQQVLVQTEPTVPDQRDRIFY